MAPLSMANICCDPRDLMTLELVDLFFSIATVSKAYYIVEDRFRLVFDFFPELRRRTRLPKFE